MEELTTSPFTRCSVDLKNKNRRLVLEIQLSGMFYIMTNKDYVTPTG